MPWRAVKLKVSLGNMTMRKSKGSCGANTEKKLSPVRAKGSVKEQKLPSTQGDYNNIGL